MKNLKGLKVIFQVFENMNRFYEGEDGAPSGAGDDSDSAIIGGAGDNNEDGDVGDQTSYVGSKDLNPEQKELNILNRDQYSNDDIDDMLMVDSEGSLFKDEKDEKTEDDDKGKDDKEPENKDDKGDADQETSDKDGAGDEEEDPEVKEFYEKSGLSPEEFNNLSEDTQGKIANGVFGKVDLENNEEHQKLKTEHAELKTSIEAFQKDPTIAARLEENKTGKAYVARGLGALTPEENQSIDDAESSDARDKIINNIVKKRAEVAIKNERSVSDARDAVKKEQKESWETLREIGVLDKKYAIEEKKLEKMTKDHKEWDGYQAGLGKIVDYLIDKKMNYGDVSRLGPKAILAAYKADNGIDATEKKAIGDNAVKGILAKLKNPKLAKDGSGRKIANSMPPGKKKVNIGGRESFDINQQTLIDQIAAGDYKGFDKAQDKYAGDPDMTEKLGLIFNKGVARGAELKRNK